MSRKRKKPIELTFRIDRELVALAQDPQKYLQEQFDRFAEKTKSYIATCTNVELVNG